MPCIRLLCLWLVVCSSLSGAEWWRLPLSGTLSGEAALFGEQGPTFRWELKGLSRDGDRRELEFTLEGAASRAEGRGMIDVRTGDGTWRLDAAEIDLISWFRFLAPTVGDSLAGLMAEGQATISGEGVLKAGRVLGRIHFRLTGGMLRSEAEGWELHGISAEGDFDVRGAGELTAAVQSVRYGGLVLKDGRVGLALGSDLTAVVTHLEVSGLGGVIAVDSFKFALRQPEVALSIKVAGIALEELTAYLPSALAEAAGRLDGQMEMRWSAADGLRIGAGWLALREESEASVRLAPVPGLITQQLEGSNPAFEPLRRIERGETALNVQVLRAVFSPQGDERGRTASIRLEAEPVDPMLKAPFVIDVNVAGPLDQLIKLGLEGGVGF